MKLKNDFSEEVRSLLSDRFYCMLCGKNCADALHHIVGRGEVEGGVESSILNACSICNYNCHIEHHGELETEEMKQKLLDRQFYYLLETGYQLNSKDRRFIKKYIKYYL